MQIDVHETGTGEDLVVLVHGVLDRGRSWSRVAEHLQDDCRMLWYDRRGYGSSAPDPRGPAGVDVHIDDLVSVVDGRRVTLAAHSFGGVIATGAAVRAAEHVKAVVLYESVLAWMPRWNDRVMRELLARDDPEEAGLRMMFRDRYDTLEETQMTRLRVEAATFVAEEASIRTGTPPYDLGMVRAPVVYGYSEQFPIDGMRESLTEALDRVEFIPVPGAGHNAHRTAPEQFAGLIRRGLDLGRTGGDVHLEEAES